MTVAEIRQRLEDHINTRLTELNAIPLTHPSYEPLYKDMYATIRVCNRIGFEVCYMGDRYIVLG